MSEIKIFLASSSELQADREQFEIFIRRRNKAWRDQNITLDLELWEDFFDAMSAEGLQSEYNKVIKECDIFVMLVHNKVGKYTAEEFDHAFGQFSETGKPLIFTYFKPYITRDKSNIKSVWAFEEKLEELKHYKSNYESIAELREDFWKQLEKYAVANGLTPAQPDAKLEPSEGLMARYRVPLQMPPLPDHFVERPEPQNAVKAQLLCDNDKGGTLVVSAIYGLGGIGKSVLASKLTHDSAVQDYFDDGILWVTLGQNPDILPLLSGWIQALGDYDYKPTAIESASNHLRTLLYNKCILLVVDDVWNPAHLEPFRVGGDKSRVMVTTREARIPDAQLHSLDVMDEAQALALMTQKIKEPLSEVARRQALEFAGRVGYLPLALDLAASQIEDGVRWQELLEDFTDEVARLESLDIYGAGEISGEMPDDEKRRKYSLLACFNLSLKQLSGEQLQQFAWLGVVPEDVRLTQEMAETLWQVRGRQAGSILRTFRAKSLVLQGAKQQSGGLAQERPSYRMHDLMHDLAQQLLQQPVEPEGEDALPGLGLTVAAAHGELLARYKAKTVAGKWHTLKDDGYIFAHLTWHMEQAQQPEEIHGLLRASNEAGPNGWYEACDAIGNPAGFVNDMGRAWAIALESYEGAPGETVALLFRYALMRTSLNSLASNIPAKMVGGLVKEGYWRASQGLAYAQQAQDPWHRAACISAIAPYMPKVLLPDVLKTIGQIQDAAFRSYPLSKLAEFFPEIWPDTLNTIQKIQDRYGRHRYQTNGFSYRAQALIGIGQKLPTRYLFTAIDISHQIQDAMDKLLALIGLATRDEELWFEVLAMARDIGDDYYRVIALTAIAQADSELWPESLAITHKIENKYYQSQALHIMAQHLPELWPETLKIIREIKSEKERANALCSMAENLPSELWLEALAIIRQIEDEEARSSALCAIAQHLPELWPEALTIIREIEFGHSRSSALCSMVKHLPSELWSEALTIIHEIEDEDDQSVSLCLMGKNLPLELWPEVLTIIREIEDEEKQAIILSTITKHLPLELWSEALTITREIKDEEEQLNVLCAIAEYLPELWPEALTITRKIKDEEAQLNTLCAIAEYLPELWPEALTITREIKDEEARSSALCSAAEHLPSELWFKALTITCEMKGGEARSTTLLTLADYAPSELWPEVLAIICEIKDEEAQSSTLLALEEYLPSELWTEVLAITRKIEDEEVQLKMLCELAKHLPQLWTEVLVRTRKTEDEEERSRALCSMAKHLPLELWPQVLTITREINIDQSSFFMLWSIVDVLRSMAEHLPSELWPEALAIIHQIEDEEDRSTALYWMVEHLPSELWPEALTITRQIEDEEAQSSALCSMAKHLPSELWPEALTIIRQIEDKEERSRALSSMAKFLPELWPEVLAISRQVENERELSGALSSMAEYLPSKLWPETLTITRQIEDKEERSRALSSMAKFLPELWPEILAIIREIEDEHARSRILHTLYTHWPESLWPEVLAIIHEIEDEYNRSITLTLIAKNLPLPKVLWPEVLAITREIKDEHARSRTLCTMAEHWPELLWANALVITGEIKDEYTRSNTLASVANHLPSQLLSQSLEIIWTIQDKYYCAKALQAFLPALEQLSIPFSEWARTLDIIAYQNRSEILKALPNSRPIVTRLGDSKTFPAILQAVREVCQQWP